MTEPDPAETSSDPAISWRIVLTPIRSDHRLSVARAGDLLLVDGQAFDVGANPDLGPDDCPWLAARVERTTAGLELTLILPHGPDAPAATLFPDPLEVTADGPVALPPWGLEGAADAPG
jgi:hypothetical protein